jgi:hypothetical protein
MTDLKSISFSEFCMKRTGRPQEHLSIQKCGQLMREYRKLVLADEKRVRDYLEGGK